MTTFHANPEVTIDAIQWTGDNADECREFTRMSELASAFSFGSATLDARLHVAANDAWLPIEIGEWIAQDARGFYPIKPDVFAKRWRSEDDQRVVDLTDVGTFEDVGRAVAEFFESEGIVPEGWILAVEDSPDGRVRVFGDTTSVAQAVGITRLAEQRVVAVGVEG